MSIKHKTFIISLKNKENNSNLKLHNKLLENGHNIEFIAATNGKKFSSTEYFEKLAIHNKFHKTIITPSELGCTLSHISAYQKIIDEELHYGIILEDDVIISELYIDSILDLTNLSKYSDFFIHLGGQEGIEHNAKKAHGERLDNKFACWRINPIDLKYIGRTVGYIISFDTAKKLLKITSESFPLIDDYTYLYEHGAFSEFIFTKLVKHPFNLSESSIENERLSLNRKSNNPGAPLIKRLFSEIQKTREFRANDKNYEKITKNLEFIIP